MANELSEPWRSFLDEIDRSTPSNYFPSSPTTAFSNVCADVTPS